MVSEITVAEHGAPDAPVESHLHPKASFLLDEHLRPTGKEEVWRFTPLNRIAALLDARESKGSLDIAWQGSESAQLGPFSPDYGVTLGAQAPFDRVAAAAFNRAGDGLHISIPAGVTLAEPIIVNATGQGSLAYGRTQISVGRGATATIIYEYAGVADYAEYLNVTLESGAKLVFVSIQDWDSDAVHGGQHSFTVGAGAELKSVTVTLGGDLVRLMETVRYVGEGGKAEMYGVYFADAGQHQEHRLFIDQNQQKTVSRVDYRGALQGEGAHTVWVGDVLIRRNAHGIDSYEANKNLILTDGARADSVPNLEIETGNILGAGHSSTTGRFDEEQLFYLMSRGISEPEARRLVVQGFFFDIIRRIGVPQVEAHLQSAVNKELERAALADLTNGEALANGDADAVKTKD